MQVRHHGWDWFWELSGSVDFLVTQIEFQIGVFSVLSIVVFKMSPKKYKNLVKLALKKAKKSLKKNFEI